MEIFDANDEYDEIFIAMLIKDFIYENKGFQVKGKRYLDENPFKQIGNVLIDNGLETGEIIYNDNKKCILKYEKENFIITYKYLTEIQEDYGVSILYTILPFTN